jgi:2-aminoethylphosphonate transport system ATP-binding protein
VTGTEAGRLAGAQATEDAPVLVDVRDVTHTFGSGRTAAHALRGVSFTVRRGHLTVLCGRSGSGKTTLLNVIGGLDVPTGGSVIVAGRDVTGMSERERMELRRETIAFIFQSFGLIPMLSAAENVGVPLRITSTPSRVREERVATMLSIVGLSEHAAHRPNELSGGQQQRIAIARALAIRPSVLLLDEPLSALDAQIRRSMVEELARLHHELPGLTVLYVTHDQTEALTLAHRIAIMRDGKLVAHGAARDLYREPPNRFTAEFLGRANLLPVKLEALEEGGRLGRVRFGATILRARVPAKLEPGAACLLCVRPHDLGLTPLRERYNALEGKVESALWQGDQHSIAMEVRGATLRIASAPLPEPPLPGTALTVHFAADSATLIPEDVA